MQSTATGSTARAPTRTRRAPPHPGGVRAASRRGRDAGSASIEFAITAVAVMAVIFTAIQAATWFWARSIALAAAQEAADAQRAHNAAPGTGQARAQAFITSTGDGLNDARIHIATTPGGVQATVSGHCLPVLPGFCNAFPVSATVHGTAERPTSP